MIKITINQRPILVKVPQYIISVADQLKINIPRLCYHQQLSTVASCRMCLVETNCSDNLLPACATLVQDGMDIITNSPAVIANQQNVLELLLANHPADCAICEHSGNCKLQQLSVKYGKDHSNYQENKRYKAASEDLGPLIKANMSRCIYCTKCIRFSEEISGMQELGIGFKSDQIYISNFNQGGISSELSGNMLDLCPAGALNAKPLVSREQPWQLQPKFSVSSHDCVGSNICYYIAANKITKALPYYNPQINTSWLADRDRFSFLGINSQARLQYPLLKKQGGWHTVSWEEALKTIATKILSLSPQQRATQLGALVSPSLTTEEYLAVWCLFNHLGSTKLDYRLRQLDFNYPELVPQYANIELENIVDLAQQKFILLIGSYLNKEQPILGISIRTAIAQGTSVVVVNPADFALNFKVWHKLLPAGGDLLLPLLQLAAAMVRIAKPTSVPETIKQALVKVEYEDSHITIANKMLAAASQESLIILGALAISHPQYSKLAAISYFISSISKATVACLYPGANSRGAWVAHKIATRQAIPVSNPQEILTEKTSHYFLVGIEPELDCIQGLAVRKLLATAEMVVACTCFASDLLLKYADVLLPMAAPPEAGGSYINATGTRQTFAAISFPPGESKSLVNIFQELAQYFAYSFTDHELQQQIISHLERPDTACLSKKEISINNLVKIIANISNADFLPLRNRYDQLILVPIVGIYAIDLILRRTTCLQATLDAKDFVSINPTDAARLKISHNDKILLQASDYSSSNNMVEHRVTISSMANEGCVIVYQTSNKTLIAPAYSIISVQKFPEKSLATILYD